ncbi:lengsin [Eublepharis macularius]|uniref:Lengsin n=1 Tax=Eublepharis macularius TaxID=481883 RepID=A0AA97JZH6_EUBMA|nr:lengsin [Eublepharis macularius]
MDKDNHRQQRTAENENEEVDGNCLCGLRNKRGVKVTAKQIPLAEFDKMDTSNPADVSALLDQERKLGYHCLQKPPGFTPQQKSSDSPPKENEASTQGGEEMHKYEELCEHSPENYGRMETSSKENLTLKTGSNNREEKPVWPDTKRSEENSGASANDQEKLGAAEGDCKFHSTQKKNKGGNLPVQEKDSKDDHVPGSGLSKETLQELKNLLSESSLLSTRARNSGKPSSMFSHTLLLNASDKQNRHIETFQPHLRGDDQKVPALHKQVAGQLGKPQLVHSSAGLDKQQSKSDDIEQPVVRQRTSSQNADSAPGIILDPTPGQHEQRKDADIKKTGRHVPHHVVSEIEHIIEQMAKDGIHFVRFEATDLHGVSRSKSIPSRFFRDKAIHGVAMPRGYLELTLNPKDTEINHISASNFNCDIVLSPDLSTFRVLPWTELTARVICDSFTVTGNPLLTSPRHIARQQLSQLQDSGFALYSAFTYEFCVYGVAELVNSKTISFPAATLLNNQDQAFIQELIDGMYHAGANIESFSSSTGPGQMEVSFHPEFGICATDSAFIFRTGIKEVAKKYNYIVSFFTENGFCNSGVLSHSLWDSDGQNNLFSLGPGGPKFTDKGKNWLAGLLAHSAALSCLMAPTIGCRKRYSTYSKDSKDTMSASWGCNDNSCAFNVKSHGEKGTQIENKLGSATANPYLVLAATIAAGLDGVRRGLSFQEGSEEIYGPAQIKAATIPLKLEDALVALQEDECIREALGDTFVRYFVAMKHYELETEEMDIERNKFLEYFI